MISAVARSSETDHQVSALRAFYHQWVAVALLLAIVIWFAWPDFLRLPQPAPTWYWLVGGSAIIRYLVLSIDERLFRFRSSAYIIRRVLWRTISPTMSLLSLAVGFRALCQRNLVGFGWLVLGGLFAMAAIPLQRWAEGWKLHRVRGGTAYKRAQVLAKLMRVRLDRIYMVPSGRGQITNAFAFGKSIGITENYSGSLHNAELDFALGHELAHIRQRHGRTVMRSVPCFYLGAGLACLLHPAVSPTFRPLFDLSVLLMPILASYYLLRRGEYEADRVALELTEDPEAAIAALAEIHQIAQVAAKWNPIAGLFMTHPSFADRARAIESAKSIRYDRSKNVMSDQYGSGQTTGKSEEK